LVEFVKGKEVVEDKTLARKSKQSNFGYQRFSQTPKSSSA
jgi:hypothetical protein